MDCKFKLEDLTKRNRKHSKKLLTAIFVAFIFLIIEMIFGLIAHSLALITDALHMFTDIGSFIISIIAIYLTSKPKTPKLNFGYQRAEVLGALANALSLWLLCFVLIYEAITRFIHPEIVNGSIVIYVASFGLIANIFMMIVLHSSHKESLNMKAAFLHVIGDLFGSIGVIISGLIIYFTGWNFVDPIISILISILILFSSSKIIKEGILILLESTPKGIDYKKVKKSLHSLPNVIKVTDLHVWSLSSHQIALSAHLEVSNNSSIATKAHQKVFDEFGISHTTFQVDSSPSKS